MIFQQFLAAWGPQARTNLKSGPQKWRSWDHPKIKNELILFLLVLSRGARVFISMTKGRPAQKSWKPLVYTAVSQCKPGVLQLFWDGSSLLLWDTISWRTFAWWPLFFLLNKEHHDFWDGSRKIWGWSKVKTFFFLENTMIFGDKKVRNLTLISSEDFFFGEHYAFGMKHQKIWEVDLQFKTFFFGKHHDFWDKFGPSSENFRQYFCPIHKVLHANCISSLRGHCMPLTYS